MNATPPSLSPRWTPGPARLLLLASAIACCYPPAVPAAPDDDGPAATPTLPAQTSRYNQGNAPGRYRDENGHIKLFRLKQAEVPLYDGAGREIGRVRKPVMLNAGAAKNLSIDGRPSESFAWAWATEAGSGWVARSALVNPPPPDVDPKRDPKPPREGAPLTIDCAAGRDKLKGLRHPNSRGVIPASGNHATDYAGRHPGPADYVYLLFACPNVIRGGTARDSLPNGSKFIPALDENGRPISEVVTMYPDGDPKRPTPVTFLYGRADGGTLYGWIARANVGGL